MASSTPDPRFLRLLDGVAPVPAAPVPLRELVLDELVEALVLFDLLQNELVGDSATPLLWIAPHLARISGEIGTLVERLGE
jgi:hypothetical protein